MKAIILLAFLLLTPSLFAAGGASHGSVMDLAFPAVNFVILMAILIWKIKTPMREHFNKQADDVAYLYESAERKDKEAKAKLAAFQQKMSTLDSEKKKIEEQAQKDIEHFKAKTQKETDEYLERIARDVDSKVAHEKAMMFKSLQEELVDDVIAKTKSTIKSSSDQSKKVTENLVARI